MAPTKKRPSRKTTRNPPDTDHPQMQPASAVDDSDSSPDTDHQNTEGRGRSLRKRKKVSYTYDDDSESASDTDHSPMERTNEGDDSDSDHGQAHPHSDHMNDDEDSAHSNDTDHSNSDTEPTSDPEHHSAGQVDEDQLSPHSTQHSADEEEGEEYIFDAPPSPSPPPPRLILTYGDRVMEYNPTIPLPHMVGAPVTFAIFMQHGDGQLQRVEPMANPPPPPLPLAPVPPPPPPAEVEMWHPPKGTLKCIFDAIKAHLGWGDNPGETDANLGESEEFVELMESLPVRGVHTLGLGPLPTTPIRQDGNIVWIKWQGVEVKALMYKVQKELFFTWSRSRKMCTVANCWSIAVDRVIGYCRVDSIKLNEIFLLRDATNVQPNIIVLHPTLRMTPHDEETINVCLRNEYVPFWHRTIAKYITEHSNCRFVVDMRWSFATTLSLEKFNTFAVATCIMTFLHNNAFPNSTHIKIRLRMGPIHFKAAVWQEVRKILARNGFKFIVTPATNQLTPNHMFPASVIKLQPHTYQGDDGNGAVKDGLLTSNTSVLASGASVGNAIPQRPLAQHLHNVVMLYQDILDPEEYDPEETETRTRHAEFMGILATLMGTILEQDFKGHPMRPLTEKLTHYDIVFDYNVFRRLFQFKTGCTIIVQREGNGIPIINGQPQFVW